MQADGQNAIPGTSSAFSQLSTLNSQPPEIPDHELLCLIGRGAYGEVWLARNAIGTMRAVKIVHRQSFERAEHFKREFKGLLKFEPISRSHDGLVDILQIGRRDDAGYFFYVMELADGEQMQNEECKIKNGGAANPIPSSRQQSILNFEFYILNYRPKTLRSELQARGRLPPAECVTLGLKLAAALEHLHANGLVHRDIKPSNIIFVNGEPKLADIGLVTAIDEAQSLVGTAGYIPPEGPGTPQADLYSLGKVLYEITLGKDRQDFPQLPPDLQSHPDYTALLELNEVILKACESDPRRRYQTAEELRGDLALLQRGESVKSRRTAQRRWAFTWKTGVAIAAVALATTVGWQLFYGIVFHQLNAPISRPVIPREVKVIAVLPFDNESQDKGDDYLGKQMAEELSTALSRIPSLRVLGRDSAIALKTASDRRAVAEQRKLSVLLVGRVRKSGTQLHLAAQLINPADDSMLWSDDCDGEIKEFPALQTRLAEGVVKALIGKLTDTDRVRLAIKATRNPEAYQFYLEARGFCNGEGTPPENWPSVKARFQAAIDLDPQFAAAYAGLASCLIAESRSHSSPNEVLQKALATAEKAVELDGTLAEAHAALGLTKYRLYDWEGAGKEFELAVKFGPNLASAHKQYATYLTSQGRFDEAIAHSRQAVELDPDSTALVLSLGRTLFDAHQYDQARNVFQTVLKLIPNSGEVLDGLGWCHFVQGQEQEAMVWWQEAMVCWQGGPQAFGKNADLSQAHRQGGMQGYWRKQLEQSLDQLKRGDPDADPFWLAADYAKAGDIDHALEWLERLYQQHYPNMPFVAVEYQLRNLHAEPRFAALLKKMGLKMPVWKQ